LKRSGLRFSGLGWRLGLAAVVALIPVVAGRIVPSFTRNWLARRGAVPAWHCPAGSNRAALGVAHAGFLGWAIAPEFRPIGVLLVLGGALNLWRLLRWRGGETFPEPLLFVLHVGYGWLVLGSALLGLSVLGWGVPPSAAIHALTAGAVGTMVLAVMTRATRGHTGRALAADRVTTGIYLLVNGAAVTRIAAAFSAAWTMPLLVASASLWIAAFALFTLAIDQCSCSHGRMNKDNESAR
jgi:uncharacterized protein involved in response to NO